MKNLVTLKQAIFLMVFITSLNSEKTSEHTERLPKIAIVGGGLAGAAAAYTLTGLFGSQLPPIDVYEGRKIGGRVQVAMLGGKEYEVGGSIIHPRNLHMARFVDILGLKKTTKDSSTRFAMFDGQSAVWASSDSEFITSLRLLWRYGLNFFSLQNDVQSFLNDFSRIYRWQNEYQSFTSVPHLLMSMSDRVLTASQGSLREHLENTLGHAVNLIDELVTVATRVNYGQRPENLHALVGLVSVAGMEPGLWSVQGGNHLVAEGLFKLARANVKMERVKRVVNASSIFTSFQLDTSTESPREYDLVIIARPLISREDNPLVFQSFSDDPNQYSKQFHTTVAHLVRGTPNFEYFGYSSLKEMPESIFSIGKDDFYSSLALQTPVDGSPSTNVYKVFANTELTDMELDQLFTTREETKVFDWLAYPEYSPQAEFAPFVLAPKLYYTNAIEEAASAMEMSAMSGINVAYLAFHQWIGASHLIDNMFVIEEKHIKLEL